MHGAPAAGCPAETPSIGKLSVRNGSGLSLTRPQRRHVTLFVTWPLNKSHEGGVWTLWAAHVLAPMVSKKYTSSS